MGKQKSYSWEFKLQMVHLLEKGTGAAIGDGGEFDKPFPNPLWADFFVSGQSGEAISPCSEPPPTPSAGTCINQPAT
jgi:hypothetical protein